MTTETSRDPVSRPLIPAALLIAILLAVAVRFIFWSELRDSPLYSQPTGDAATYVSLAEELRTEGPLAPRGEAYSQGPLYPVFLRLTGAVGAGTQGVQWIQYLLGTVSVGLLWVLGRRLGGPLAGAVAAIGAALYGPFVSFEGVLLSISLAVFLLLLGLVAWRPRTVLLGGLCFGLAALAQPNLLLGGLLVAGVGLARPRLVSLPSRRSAVLATVGLLLPVLLVTARNFSESGSPVLISANGGINFFIGNNPAGDGTFHLPPDSGLLNRPEGLFTSARDVAEQDHRSALSASAVDRYWWMKGLDFWIGQPGASLGLFGRKVLLALNNYEIPNNFDYTFLRAQAPVLNFLLTFGFLFPLGGVGLILAWRRGRRVEALWFLGILVSVALFFVTARYRLPLAALLFPAAGLAVARVWEGRRQIGKLLPIAGGVALYAVLAFVPLVEGGAARAHMFNLEGTAQYRNGDFAGAEASFRKALELVPDQAEARNNLGRLLAQKGDAMEAVHHYRLAMIANPDQAETYFNLEELYRQGGRTDEAMAILSRLETARAGRLGDIAGAIAYRRGLNVLANGDTAQARALFGKATELDPSVRGAWDALASLNPGQDPAEVAGDGPTERPFGELEAEAKAHRLDRDVQLRYAAALAASGRLEEAIGAYEFAWKLSPSRPEAPYEIGMLYLELGDIPHAEGHLRAAADRGAYPPALLNLGKIYEALDRDRDARIVYQVLLNQPRAAVEKAEAKRRLQALGGASPR